MATLQEIKDKLKAEKERTNTSEGGTRQRSSGGDNASYAFWDIKVGEMATVRFLPDANPDNTYFWVKREVVKLPFDGVVGGDYPTNKQVTVTVPCADMWEPRTCPIQRATKSWWDDPSKKPLAQLYWKKKSYIFEGFVVQSPFEEKVVPENPIRRFMINPSIFEIIEKSLMDSEMEDMPTDYVGGVDFRIRKTQKGEHANYSTSEWSRKTRSLSEDELTIIEQHGLHDLNKYRGERPDSDALAAIFAMWEDSVKGNPFDMESYGQYYRPYGVNDDQSASRGAPAARPVATPVAVDEDEPEASVKAPAASPAAAGSNTNAHDILERIKNRTMSKG
jgi:hypothetical protein